MRKKLCLLLSLLLTFQSISTITANAEKQDDNTLYYTEEAINNWYRNPDTVESVTPSGCLLDGESIQDDSVTLTSDSVLSFKFSPSVSGKYGLALSYRLTEEAISLDTLVNVSVNDNESLVTQLQLFWYDSVRNVQDRNGDDINPKQNYLRDFALTPLLEYADISRNHAVWELEGGKEYTFKLVSTIQAIEIHKIEIYKSEEIKKYDLSGKKADDLETITIEGENYSLKSDSYIRSSSVRNPAITPYDSFKQRINVLDGSTWKTSGQKVIWEFEAKKAGYYKLGLHVRQNNETNKSVFRNIEIDGKTPYSEWENAKFEYTSASGYKNITLKSNNEDCLVYLEKGNHTIAMTVTAGSYEKVYQDVYDLMMDIDEFGLALLRLTAGSTDENRTWDMKSYMPDATDKIKEFAKSSGAIYEELKRIENTEPTYAMDLETVSDKLRDLLEEPETIPNKTEEIFRGDTSASKYLGNILNKLSNHGMWIDKIYFYGNDKLPKEKASFFVSTLESIKRFFWSFLPDAVADYNLVNDSKEDITVWVGQSAIITDILQQIVDEDYNLKYNKNIKLVVMPSEQKLVLANASGENPDVVIASGGVFTFASRDALKNLLDYEDFLSFYNSEYEIESLVTTSYGDGVYGATESKGFNLLFYRKDILESLNLTVPNTWDDVRKMMPTLLRSQMNFYIPISSSSAIKGLGATSPFIFQNGGEIYSTNGHTTEINSPESINAITEMTEFYRIYGMQTTVSSFYNSFRYGDVPIGMGDFGMYLQLSMAAPELAGLWGVALCPGTKQEDGTVLRYQPANQTACFIFNNTDMPEESWHFMKWWLSSDTQLEFSTRRSATFGPEYQWNTANIKAFKQLPFDNSIKQLALDQWEHQREIVPHPAGYIVERELSGVWNDVVIDNKAMIESLDKAVIATNREFRRKLQEFGYVDSKGNLIKDYNVKIIDMLYKKLEEVEGKNEE